MKKQNQLPIDPKTPAPVGLHAVVSPQPDTAGRLEQAKRHALHHFDEWNSVTGVPHPHTGHYYEIASLIEDAVEFGYGVAHGKTFKQIKRRINAG